MTKFEKLINLTKNTKSENERLQNLVLSLQDDLDKRYKTVEKTEITEKCEISAEQSQETDQALVATEAGKVISTPAESASTAENEIAENNSDNKSDIPLPKKSQPKTPKKSKKKNQKKK